MLWADPGEIQQTGRTTKVLGALKERAARLRKELLIESAYFVPGKRGVEDFRRMTERGVRVRVLLDEDGSLVWTIEAGGQTRRYHTDPQSTAGQRAAAGLIGILPVEGQL